MWPPHFEVPVASLDLWKPCEERVITTKPGETAMTTQNLPVAQNLFRLMVMFIFAVGLVWLAYCLYKDLDFGYQLNITYHHVLRHFELE